MLSVTNHYGNTNQNHNEYYFTSICITAIKKTENNKCWQGCGIIEHLCTVGNVKLCCCYWKVMAVFKKLKIQLLYDLAIPFLDCMERNWKRYLQNYLHRRIRYNIQKERATQVSTDGQNVLYTHEDYYSSLKRKGILTPGTIWMKPEDIKLS